jgi:hypothetical protein
MTLLGFGPGELAAITAIMTLATLVQMGLGLGLSLVMIPLLALVSPTLVPGPAVCCAFVLMPLMIHGNAHLIDRVEIGWGAFGLVVGTAVGVVALVWIDPVHLPRVFGAMILIAVALALSGLRLKVQPRDIAGASIVSGVMGGMSGIHGPLIGIVYAGEEPAKIRATLALYWIIAYAIMIAMHVIAGRFGWIDVARAGVLMPGLLLGYKLAPLIVRHIDRQRMRWGMLTIATLGALMLLIRG